MSYAGDVSPRETFEAVSTDPDAILVDVRTPAEWQFVGVADLGAVGKQVVGVTWPGPGQGTPADFVERLEAAGLDPAVPTYFICRSGQRSRSAAIAATAAGWATAYNVAEGFEGGVDGAGHRATIGGWKVAGLPWRQT